MTILSQAEIDVSIQGKNQISSALYTDAFTVLRKAEYEFNDMTIDDEAQVLPISKLTPISKIIANSNGMVLQVNDATIPVSGTLLWNVAPDYTISGISVYTNSVAPVYMTISLIGV